MRIPIILYMILFCLTQYCLSSETEKEALKEKQEKLELNYNLNNDVMKSVKENIRYLTFLELCFAKPEFLELIKNDSSFRDAWKEKIAGIPIPTKGYSNIQNQFFEFFNGVFLKDQTGNYAEQVAFLKQYHPKVIEDKYLSERDYGNKVAKYGKSDDYIYNIIFDLLILDSKSFLVEA